MRDIAGHGWIYAASTRITIPSSKNQPIPCSSATTTQRSPSESSTYAMPPSESGPLAGSARTKRGWTFQEFVIYEAADFYQKDWTFYLITLPTTRSPLQQGVGGCDGYRRTSPALPPSRDGMGADRDFNGHRHTSPHCRKTSRTHYLVLREQLEQLRAPRFANFRLHLPCTAFRVTDVRRRRDATQETHFVYEVKADGLRDLSVATDETLIQLSRVKPTRQTLLLVRPRDWYLFEVPDFSDGNGPILSSSPR